MTDDVSILLYVLAALFFGSALCFVLDDAIAWARETLAKMAIGGPSTKSDVDHDRALRKVHGRTERIGPVSNTVKSTRLGRDAGAAQDSRVVVRGSTSARAQEAP